MRSCPGEHSPPPAPHRRRDRRAGGPRLLPRSGLCPEALRPARQRVCHQPAGAAAGVHSRRPGDRGSAGPAGWLRGLVARQRARAAGQPLPGQSQRPRSPRPAAGGGPAVLGGGPAPLQPRHRGPGRRAHHRAGRRIHAGVPGGSPAPLCLQRDRHGGAGPGGRRPRGPLPRLRDLDPRPVLRSPGPARHPLRQGPAGPRPSAGAPRGGAAPQP